MMIEAAGGLGEKTRRVIVQRGEKAKGVRDSSEHEKRGTLSHSKRKEKGRNRGRCRKRKT